MRADRRARRGRRRKGKKKREKSRRKVGRRTETDNGNLRQPAGTSSRRRELQGRRRVTLMSNRPGDYGITVAYYAKPSARSGRPGRPRQGSRAVKRAPQPLARPDGRSDGEGECDGDDDSRRRGAASLAATSRMAN